MAEETNTQRIARQRREAGGINAGRTDGAPKVMGYSRFRQGPAARNFSNLDAFYANQRGAPSSSNPAFAGLTADEVAMEMKRRGETTRAGGTSIIPDTRMPPRTRPVNGAGQDTAPDGLSGEGQDVSLSPTGGYVNTPDQQDPFRNVKPAAAPAPAAAVQPVDPSTVRQPVGRVGNSDARGALDAAGNPASESNPAAGTPAEFRQMARDAAMGRTVNTVGTTGGVGKVFADTAPAQAGNYRRMITSKYGTGTNVAREPGQGPATTKDLMGRTVPLGQYLREQKEVQRTKGMA